MNYLHGKHLLYVFQFIQQEWTGEESAPAYAEEANGLADLKKVLEFVQNDLYYPTFAEKCAYLICSLAGAQYFSNGNKRLAVMILLTFLAVNRADIRRLTSLQFQDTLRSFFHDYVWIDQIEIEGPHAQFIYNLAIVIGDPNVWGTDKFDALKKKVGEICGLIYRLPEME